MVFGWTKRRNESVSAAMTWLRRTGLFCFFLASAAASASASPTTIEDLVRAHRLWQSSETNEYLVRFVSYSDDRNSRRIDARHQLGAYVRNDRIVALLPLGAQPPSVAPDADQLLTVDGIFRLLYDAFDGQVSSVHVTAAVFHERYGYPLHVRLADYAGSVVLRVLIKDVLLLDSLFLKELDVHATDWREHGPDFYDMLFQNHCLPPGQDVEYRVSVEHGHLVDRITAVNPPDDSRVDEGAEVATSLDRHSVYTVDEVFSEIAFHLFENLAASEPYYPVSVDVQYDAWYGYPTRAEIISHKAWKPSANVATAVKMTKAWTSSPLAAAPSKPRIFNLTISSVLPRLDEELADMWSRWNASELSLGLYGMHVKTYTARKGNEPSMDSIPLQIVQVENSELYSIQDSSGIEDVHYDYAQSSSLLTWNDIVQTAASSPIYLTVEQLYKLLGSAIQNQTGASDAILTAAAAQVLDVNVRYRKGDHGIPETVRLTYRLPNEDVPNVFFHQIEALITYSLSLQQLQVQYELWLSMQMENYNFVLQSGCACKDDSGGTAPWHIGVRNSTTVQLQESTAAYQHSTAETLPPTVRTVSALFRYIHRALLDTPHRYYVEYDKTFGYPSFASIEQIADDTEASWQLVVDDLFPLRDTELQSNLTDALQLWGSFDMNDYLFSYASHHDNTNSASDEIWVKVEEGSVVRVYDPEDYSPDYIADDHETYTIEEWFALVQYSIDVLADTIEADFDPRYGFPRSVLIAFDDGEVATVRSIRIDQLTPYSLLEADVMKAKDVWNDEGFTSYSYVMVQRCDCRHNNRPIRVSVKSNEVSSIQFVEGDEQQTANMSDMSGVRAFSVPEFHEIIEQAVADDAYRIDATYDELGRPTSILIDYGASREVFHIHTTYDPAEEATGEGPDQTTSPSTQSRSLSTSLSLFPAAWLQLVAAMVAALWVSI